MESKSRESHLARPVTSWQLQLGGAASSKRFLNLENSKRYFAGARAQEVCPSFTTAQAHGECAQGGTGLCVGGVGWRGTGWKALLRLIHGVSWAQVVKKIPTTATVFSAQSKHSSHRKRSARVSRLNRVLYQDVPLNPGNGFSWLPSGEEQLLFSADLSLSLNSSLLGRLPPSTPWAEGGKESASLERGSPQLPLGLQVWLRLPSACPSPLPQCVLVTSAGVVQRAREAHTHPELLLVRGSLSVCPPPSLIHVPVL